MAWKMKDSGIEWIGEIPEGWEITKIKHIVSSVTDIDHFMPDSAEFGIPYLMIGDLKDLSSSIDWDSSKKISMERGTEYALEQIYNIVDSRYRSRKPLIVTTNLTLDEIRHPQNTAHARIYDRLLEMCVPISCIGVSFRKETAQEKMERLKSLIG